MSPDPVDEPPERRVRWPAAHRILPSRYPPIQLFERLTEGMVDAVPADRASSDRTTHARRI